MTYKFLENVDRIDILCGFVSDPPVHPCEICKSTNCNGENKCKGYGSYILSNSIQ